MITDLVRGGELFTQVNKNVKHNRTFTELETKMIAFELLLAVENFNKIGVMICDIRPENILFQQKYEPLGQKNKKSKKENERDDQ